MNRDCVRYASLLALAALVAAMAGCSESAPAIATFTTSPPGGVSPLSVRFDATTTLADPASYAWDFGDGTQDSGQRVDHTYRTAVASTFHVILVATDSGGRRATAEGDIAVTPSAAPPLHVRFTWPFHFDAQGDDAVNLNDEYFTIENAGATAADLSGWTVENERGVSYRIPGGVFLVPNAILTVHSGAGLDTPGIVHWNADAPVWSNNADIAILRDTTGDIVDVYAYASCSASRGRRPIPQTWMRSSSTEVSVRVLNPAPR